MSYRLKLFLFAVGALGILFVLNVGNSALNTISQLDAIEAQRDTWQRPSDVLQALDLKAGETVVDLGCGSGYFTLRLARAVGKSGVAVGEDIRKEPLAFLWARTLMRREASLRIIYGKWNDPHLPGRVDAVLISNTYHEFVDPQAILTHVRESLLPGGRLVVLDRLPPARAAGAESLDHEISPDTVISDLRQSGFEVTRRQDHFIESDPGLETWWMIVAKRP